MLSGTTEFKRVQADPTLSRLRTVQNYLSTLENRGEISEQNNKIEMRHKFAQVGKAYGLPKNASLLNHYQNLDQSLALRTHPIMVQVNISQSY